MSLYLIRHASASQRGQFPGGDFDRPLDERGRQQAAALASHFADIPVRAVWSSIATRCIETVAPLATANGVEVLTCGQLTEGAQSDELLKLLRREALNEGNLIMCSHGDLIPEVLNALLRDGMRLLGARGCERASIWELQTHNGDIVGATYTRPG